MLSIVSLSSPPLTQPCWWYSTPLIKCKHDEDDNDDVDEDDEDDKNDNEDDNDDDVVNGDDSHNEVT